MHRNKFFSCFIIQIGSSTSIFFFPGVDLIEKPKFGDQKLSSSKSSKKHASQNDNFLSTIIFKQQHIEIWFYLEQLDIYIINLR